MTQSHSLTHTQPHLQNINGIFVCIVVLFILSRQNKPGDLNLQHQTTTKIYRSLAPLSLTVLPNWPQIGLLRWQSYTTGCVLLPICQLACAWRKYATLWWKMVRISTIPNDWFQIDQTTFFKRKPIRTPTNVKCLSFYQSFEHFRLRYLFSFFFSTQIHIRHTRATLALIQLQVAARHAYRTKKS